MNKKLLKNDFFTYVNGEWLKKTKIPSDQSGVSSYSQKTNELRKNLRQLVEKWATNKTELPNDPIILEMIKLYKMVKNNKMQNKQGWNPVKKQIEEVMALSSFNEIYNNFKHSRQIIDQLPFDFSVEEDFIDNTLYTLWISEMDILLPSREYYFSKDKKRLQNVIKEVTLDLMLDYGMSKSKAQNIIKEALEFDELIAQYHLSSEEKADYTSLYNPYQNKDINQFSKKFDLHKLASSLVNQEVKQVVVANKKYFNELDNLFNEENFNKFKSLTLVHNFLSYAPYLTSKTREIIFKYSQAISGVKKPKTTIKRAFDLASGVFWGALSMYWGKTNFTEEARKDVARMIYKIIDVYKQRLSVNTWLTPQTIEAAKRKLDCIKPMVGYPEYIENYYSLIHIKTYKEGGSVYSNLEEYANIIDEYRLSRYNQRVDQNLWGMNSYEANAYFNPFSNRIVFPAGYLQAPFYDYNANSSANYGGLGMTIGHEISHAFDNNGAQFDENGSYNNWWQESDYENFKVKTQQMIELFDGYPTKYGKVNGKLTVSENIADNGGIVSALEAAKSEKDFSYDEFFTNFARCERGYRNKEVSIRLLLVDVHAPAKERVNLQLKNCQEFQDFYKLEEGDELYSPKEKIFEIW